MAGDLRDWVLTFRGWDPAEQPLREALTTLGNGHFATRGAAEEVRAGGPHYPGTYLAGGYDRARSSVAGRTIENEDLVNWPNWLPLSFRCDGDQQWFEVSQVDVIDYEVRLELLLGLLVRQVHFRDPAGRTFLLRSQRLVHMGNPNVAAQCWELTPLDWSGILEIRSGLDGSVSNEGVARYGDLTGAHHEVVHAGTDREDTTCLVVRAHQSGVVVAQAARTRVYDAEELPTERVDFCTSRQVCQHIRVSAREQRPLRVEKVVTLYSSRDFAISDPRTAACTWAARQPRFEALLEQHRRAWRLLWRHVDLELTSSDPYPQPVLRLHLFHLLQTASFHTIDRDVGLPARGLHGEAYRGHVFWDELFAFPLFNLHLPELTRSFLMYRYRRLDEARWAARREGYEGAMFPWQSGSDGREETQTLMLNPRSGRWIPDNTHRQRHVGSAIAYNVWQYHEVTGDREFLASHGAELLLEISRFWASIAKYDELLERYVIRGVVGPDEFHTKYPRRDGLGLNDNAYTNVMAAWVLKTTLQAVELLADDRRTELLDSLGLGPDDLRRWDRISRCMYVPFHGDRIISQFDGWDELEEIDWAALRERYGNIRRLDRLLEAENDDINRYKASKQADVLMLFFLLGTSELEELFERMGYEWDDDLVRRNSAYYLERTSDGSTLSKVVHAWVMARTDRKHSWSLFREALASDVEDIQGGTTPEGIHIGAMAGTVDLIERCYTGLEVRQGALWLNPQLPDELDHLRLRLRYREHWLTLHVTRRRTTVGVERGTDAPVHVGYHGEVHALSPGESRVFEH